MRIPLNARVAGVAVLAGSAAGAVAWALTAPDARARWADAPPDGFNGFNEWFEVVRWVIPASAVVAVVASLVALALSSRVDRRSVWFAAARIVAWGAAGWLAGWVLGALFVWAGPVVPIILPAAVVAAGAWRLARPREPLASSA